MQIKLIINLIILALFATQADALVFQTALTKYAISTKQAEGITSYFQGTKNSLTFEERDDYIKAVNSAIQISKTKYFYNVKSKQDLLKRFNELIIFNVK